MDCGYRIALYKQHLRLQEKQPARARYVTANKRHAANHGKGPLTYAPIVQALTRLPESEKARLKHKFDIAYLVATESMPF